MNDDELKKIWLSSPNEDLDLIEKSRMINEVQSDIKKWDKMLKHGNSTRGVLIIILIGWTIIFGMVAFTTSDTQSKIGVILCLLIFVYVMIRIIGEKKRYQQNFSETYLDYLYQIKKHLKGHKKVYDFILYVFYPLIATGLLLFRLDSFTTIGVAVIEFLIVIGIGISFYFFHKWVLKMFIIRRMGKIDKLIETLEEY